MALLRDSLRAMIRIAVLLALPLGLLSACGSPGETQGTTPITQGEAEALEDAASMLDEQRPNESGQDTDGTEFDGESE